MIFAKLARPSNIFSTLRDRHRERETATENMPSILDIAGGGGGVGGEGRGRSLGQCAETMGVTTGIAFWLAVAQLPVMMGLVLHYPSVRIDVFVPGIRLATDPATNLTAVAFTNESAVYAAAYDHGVGISGLYVLSASSFTFFAVLTMNFLERGLASASDEGRMASSMQQALIQQMEGEEFVLQNLGMVSDPTFRTWNQVLLYISGPHCICQQAHIWRK